MTDEVQREREEEAERIEQEKEEGTRYDGGDIPRVETDRPYDQDEEDKN